MIGLSDTPIDAAAVLDAVADPEHGGTAAFLGTTRRESGAHPVAALEYEAYAELAIAEMSRIAAEAGGRHGARVAVVHRTGRVEVGHPGVAVAASAPHRAAALGACRYVIDQLKARVPIWKRTVHADGSSAWIDGREPAEQTHLEESHDPVAP